MWLFIHAGFKLIHVSTAQVTLCRSGGPDLYDLKNRRERHGRLMKSLGSLLGWETIGSDREASTTKFYCKTLSCWPWLWLRSIHGSISVVCGIGNVVGLSYPAWGHSWTACGYSWTAYGWSWRSGQYNHSKLSNWCELYVFIYFKICVYHVYRCIYVHLLIIWVCSWVEDDSTLLIVLMRKSRSYNYDKWEWEFKYIWEEFIKRVLNMTHSSIDIGPL